MAEDTESSRYPRRMRKPVCKLLEDNPLKTGKSWTVKEQESLLAALEEYGDQDVSLLASKVRTKNAAQIYRYLVNHREAAAEQLKRHGGNKLEKHAFLEMWIDYIRAKKQKFTAPSPLALSMLMISLLEDHPVPTDGEVNFTEAYGYMFRLFSGRHTNRRAEMGDATSKFIKLSYLRLLKSTKKTLDQFHEKFIEAANPEERLNEDHLNHLPKLSQQLMTSSYFNPLLLREDVLNVAHNSAPSDGNSTATNIDGTSTVDASLNSSVAKK